MQLSHLQKELVGNQDLEGMVSSVLLAQILLNINHLNSNIQETNQEEAVQLKDTAYYQAKKKQKVAKEN